MTGRPPRGLGLRAASMAAILLLAVAACGVKKERPPAGSSLKAWTEYPGNPIIRFGQTVPFTVWNDPSVLKEDDGRYRMWLSGGDARDLQHIVVHAYVADSTDGVHWNIDPKPCLSPSSNAKDWDSLRIETPSVVKVGGRYHMYYTGFDEQGAKEGISSIGHAVSPDGIHWEKDRANPVIRDQQSDKFQWAYRGAGEPGVVYNSKDQTFYLYYVGLSYGRKNPSIGHIGILLAKSRDGSHFINYGDESGERALILTRDVPGAIDGSWFGYSNPAPVLARDGEFHMFCTFLVCPKGPASARHVTIDHAVSHDGIHFTVVEQNIFEAAKKDWKDQQVRSPTTIVDEDGRFQMWFAGESQTPYYISGIGYATREH